MSKRITEHIRSNVVGYVAIFLFAVTGTAIALPGTDTVDSGDIINGEVKSPDIENLGIQSGDLATQAVNGGKIAPNAVTSGRIGDNQVKTQDVADDTLPGGGGGLAAIDLQADSVNSSELAPNSVTGAEVADNSITGADINDSLAASASDTGGGCNDDDANGEVCATTNITLGETSKLLVNATGGWHTHGTSGQMSCRLDHDGIETIGVPQSIGEVGANHPLGGGDGTMALTGISLDIGPGTHAISLICTQTDADLDLTNSNLTVATVDE
jgi:hypothetical protein